MCVPVCSAIVQRIRERRPGRQAGTNEWAFPSPAAENMENYRKFSVNWFLGLSIGWWCWWRRRFFSSLNTAFVRAQSSRQGKFMQMAVTAGLVVWMRFFQHRVYLLLIDPNEWVCFSLVSFRVSLYSSSSRRTASSTCEVKSHNIKLESRLDRRMRSENNRLSLGNVAVNCPWRVPN